jgi:GNAT superfamily N-acetyltransferase
MKNFAQQEHQISKHLPAGGTPLNSHNLIIRRASAGDGEAMANVSLRVWNISLKDIVSQNFLAKLQFEIQKEKYAGRATDADWLLLVAEVGGKIVGMIGAKDNDSEPLLYEKQIKAMYVDPAFQGQGIGAALFARIVKELKERNTRTLVLWCMLANTKALRFYEKLGGKKIEGIIPPEEYSGMAHVAYTWDIGEIVLE